MEGTRVRMNRFRAALDVPPERWSVEGGRRITVPDSLKSVNPQAFVPEALFLGFLNRSDPEQELGWDRYKPQWARQFLAWKAHEAGSSTGSYSQQWQEFVTDLGIDVEDAREMYGTDPPFAVEAEVVEDVLAMDALFVCLLLCEVFGNRQWLPAKFFGEGRVTQLVCFGGRDTLRTLFSDISLVENQLPLYILARVIHRGFPPSSVLLGYQGADLFTDLLANYLWRMYGNTFELGRLRPVEVQAAVAEVVCMETAHLLQSFLQLVCFAPEGNDEFKTSAPFRRSFRSASAMHRVGIRVTGASPDCPTFIHQIRFDMPTSRLLVPCIIFDGAEKVFRNLAACEQQSSVPGSPTPFLSYLVLMNDIIDTGEDVHMLVKSGVLGHQEGSDDKVADIWNNMTTNFAHHQPNYLFKVSEQVEKRYNKTWPKLWAEFWQIYLSRPWYTVSFLAAFALLALTVAQTVYTILAYGKQQP